MPDEETDNTKITEVHTVEKERKHYDPLPDDAPRNSLGRKKKPRVLTKAVLMYMTPLDLYNLKQSAAKAEFNSYAAYVRFLSTKIVTEDSLIVTLSKKTMGNLKDQAKAMGKTVEEYVRYLATLKVSA
jgi:hypothetical protein